MVTKRATYRRNRITATARTTPITRQAAATPTMRPRPPFGRAFGPVADGTAADGAPAAVEPDGTLALAADDGSTAVSPLDIATNCLSAVASSAADRKRSSG